MVPPSTYNDTTKRDRVTGPRRKGVKEPSANEQSPFFYGCLCELRVGELGPTLEKVGPRASELVIRSGSRRLLI
jgi:hypothetical protein